MFWRFKAGIEGPGIHGLRAHLRVACCYCWEALVLSCGDKYTKERYFTFPMGGSGEVI